jgi:hypothetical protein
MLRFRMKMLSKENLMAKTSDIGSCLRLLTGKLLIVGFVMASVYGSSGAGEISHKDILFSDKSELQLKRLAAQAMNANAVLEKSAELLQQQLALQEQETKLLQEQLAAQPAPKTPVRIKKRRDTLTDAVTNLTSGVFATPLGGTDKSAIVSALETAELTGDDVHDFLSVCTAVEVHIKRRTPTPNSVTALAITDGGPAVGAPMALVKMGPEEKPCDEPTDLNDIFNLFKRRLAGVMGPNFLAFYTKEFDVFVVAKKASSPMKQTIPSIDLNAIGQEYVDSIAKVLSQRGPLHSIVTYHMFRFESHELLIEILKAQMQKTAENFRPTPTKNLITTANELRDCFYKTATFAFFNYISGNSNKSTQGEIVALSLTSRRGDISEESFVTIQQELYKIFYPEVLPTFVMTKIEFGGARGAASGGYQMPGILPGRPVVTAITWGASVINQGVSAFFACLAPNLQRELLEDDTSSPAPQIGASKQITDMEAKSDRVVNERGTPEGLSEELSEEL